jgi:hypothetical protein
MDTDETQEYDIRCALHDAAHLLSTEFGSVDQKAAVDLATFLWRSRVHEQFQKAHPVPDRMPYGVPDA